MRAIEIGFTQGVVNALAQLIRGHNENAAEGLWNESGFTEDDLKVCDDYDVKEVRKMLSKM